MKNEETIVAIAETTCGGNIYFYNCYDIWIAKWGNSGYIESVGGCISLVFFWDFIDYNGNVRN